MPTITSLLKHVTLKRSVVAVSTAAAIGLIVFAIHFRRKRQKNFPNKKDSKPKHRRNELGSTSPSNGKYSKRPHKRSISYSPSIASSTTSSCTSSYRRRRKRVVLPDSGEHGAVEKLYQEGISSFEAALEKWEKATDILRGPNSEQQNTGSMPDPSCSEHSSLRGKHVFRRRRNRVHSVSDLQSFDSRGWPQSKKAARQLKDMSHSNSMGDLYEMFDDMPLEEEDPQQSFDDQLHRIVSKAKRIQETIDFMLFDENTEDSDTDITLIGVDESFSSNSDTESTSSYFSAREFWDTRSIDSYSRRLHMYEEALVAVEKGEVTCRTSRSSLLNCLSEDEFLAKLHCLRQGLEVMLQDLTVRNWLIDSGRSMIECILCVAGQNLEEFQEAFTKMIDYVSCKDNWKEIESELKGRRVVRMSFYDIVLDFLLMDAFDDLSCPPGPVVSIMQNKWLADSLKESALYTAVWSVLKAKRSRLQYSNGFVAHMYDISTHVTPALAWGFLGPDGKLKNICEYFKKEVMDFLCGLFSFEHIRYTTPAQMADDILKLSRKRFADLTNYLQNAIGDTGNSH